MLVLVQLIRTHFESQSAWNKADPISQYHDARTTGRERFLLKKMRPDDLAELNDPFVKWLHVLYRSEFDIDITSSGRTQKENAAIRTYDGTAQLLAITRVVDIVSRSQLICWHTEKSDRGKKF